MAPPFTVDSALDALKAEDPETVMSWFTLIYRKNVLELVTAAAIGVAGWEHLLMMPAELRTWRLLWNGNWNPARAVVLLARYTVIVASVFTLLFFYGQPRSCQAIFMTIYGLYILLWASCASIFLMRLSIIYEKDRRVMTGFTVLLIACVAVWTVVIVEGYESYEVPEPIRIPRSGKCTPGHIPRWCSVSWAASTVYDGSIFAATLIALQKYKRSASRKSLRTQRWIWNSNLVFFSVAIVFNILSLVTEVVVEDDVLKHLPAPVSFVMHVVVASRLVLASKGWNSGAVGEEEWELDGTGKGGGVGGGGDHPRGRRSILDVGHHSQSIAFDVTVEERIEYRPELSAGGGGGGMGASADAADDRGSQSSNDGKMTYSDEEKARRLAGGAAASAAVRSQQREQQREQHSRQSRQSDPPTPQREDHNRRHFESGDTTATATTRNSVGSLVTHAGVLVAVPTLPVAAAADSATSLRRPDASLQSHSSTTFVDAITPPPERHSNAGNLTEAPTGPTAVGKGPWRSLSPGSPRNRSPRDRKIKALATAQEKYDGDRPQASPRFR